VAVVGGCLHRPRLQRDVSGCGCLCVHALHSQFPSGRFCLRPNSTDARHRITGELLSGHAPTPTLRPDDPTNWILGCTAVVACRLVALAAARGARLAPTIP